MKLIGLSGRMGVGKSTAIECIRDLQQNYVHLIKFAQPLYDIQEAIYRRINTVYKRPESFVKDRKLLQWLGTEWGRGQVSDTLWVDLWRTEAHYIMENFSSHIIVCDDVRFDNEVEVIKSLGGTIILLESDKADSRIDTKTGIAGHVSESGISLNKVDHVIQNNGSVDDLKKSLSSIILKR